MKNIISIITILFTSVLFFSCDSNDSIPDIDFTMKMNKDVIVILVDEEDALDVQFTPIESVTDIKWTIDDTEIASIDQSGKIKGLKAGTTKVKAIYKHYQISSSVYVKTKHNVEKISFPNESYYVNTNASLKLDVLLEPNVDTKVYWSVENKDILSINDIGVITGLKPGSSKVTARVGDKEATCFIYVAGDPNKVDKRYLLGDLFYARLGATVDEIIAAESFINKRTAIKSDNLSFVYESNTNDSVVTYTQYFLYQYYCSSVQVRSTHPDPDECQQILINKLEETGCKFVADLGDDGLFRNTKAYAHPEINDVWILCAIIRESADKEAAYLISQEPFALEKAKAGIANVVKYRPLNLK